MNILSAVGLWLILSVVDPLFPPNAVLGGTVVAELHFVSGRVESVRVFSGEEPFVSSCKTALAGWHTDSGQDGDELVIVHFRQPYLYFWGEAKEEIKPATPQVSLPYPISIVPPAYPANELGEGSVVLRLGVSVDGEVSDVQVVKSVGALTDASIASAKKWKFSPAVDKQGVASASHAYAVLVYRFPITAPAVKGR